ncbi:carbohydrate ABC transporter permease [Vibrio sp. DW001]|uniref:carbohydrate ABC transporter permease n=1 Tax=Vibrio sp. DW001 TaxID=2912315 RepID=UPI0023B190A1|nr:carbohydrate ABC transporter permease [Vibrio sp. DW001]WED28529.1 carbohydrate ABC transporter permease [Vibrio sp. DW001]
MKQWLSKENRKSIVIHVVLLVLLMIWMIPEIYMFTMALRTPAQVFDPSLFVWPITWDNFVTVIVENPLHVFFINSIIVTVMTVLAVIVLSSLFAFAISVLKLPGSLVLYAILLTTLMVPIASLVLPLAILLKNFDWVNRYLGLILPYIALGVPFSVVVLKAFFEDSPTELFDAAKVDGCNAFQVYWHIALPMVRPALVFVAIWQFIVTWNEFFLALVIMTETEMKTITIIPMQYSGFYMANPGALFAILAIIAIPLIFLYVLVQKAFVRGLTAGAVKG